MSEQSKLNQSLNRISKVIRDTLDAPTFIEPKANCRNLVKTLQEIEAIIRGDAGNYTLGLPGVEKVPEATSPAQTSDASEQKKLLSEYHAGYQAGYWKAFYEAKGQQGEIRVVDIEAGAEAICERRNANDWPCNGLDFDEEMAKAWAVAWNLQPKNDSI